MLRVKTYLAPSSIHGIGLFAGGDIPRGTIVDRLDATFDQIIVGGLAGLSSWAAAVVRNYAYLDATGTWILAADDARFFNHSDNPNCQEAGPLTIAARDIPADEELTCDYRTFDLDWKRKLGRES